MDERRLHSCVRQAKQHFLNSVVTGEESWLVQLRPRNINSESGARNKIFTDTLQLLRTNLKGNKNVDALFQAPAAK
jgi:hypothetical protein